MDAPQTSNRKKARALLQKNRYKTCRRKKYDCCAVLFRSESKSSSFHANERP